MRALHCVRSVSVLALPSRRADEISVGTDQQTSIAVTIFNQDLALIRDVRKIDLAAIDLAAGLNDIAFIDVSAGIRPETALLTTAGGGLTVTEQNFDFDLLTPEKLLEKSVGTTIRVVRTNPTTGADSAEDAKVLSVANGMAVLQIGDRIETAIPGRLVYSAVPPNLRARPTLVTKAISEKAGSTDVVLSYLTHGLSWQADYVASLSADETTIDLNGWVTLTNQSGVTYKDAKLQLVAGPGEPGAADAPARHGAAGSTDDGDGEGAADGGGAGLRVPPLPARHADHDQGEPDQAGGAAGRRQGAVTKQYLITDAANVWGRYSTTSARATGVNAHGEAEIRQRREVEARHAAAKGNRPRLQGRQPGRGSVRR